MKRVLVVYKKSVLQYLEKNIKSLQKIESNNPQLHKKLVQSDKNHKKSLEKVLNVLEKKNYIVRKVFRASFSHEEKTDLVISVGGDGTLLESAKNLKETPILSVNSDTKSSVGFYSACNASNFENALNMLGSKLLPLRSVSRLQATINNKLLPIYILNDILLSHRNPAHATRFILGFKNQKVRYKSSGIWVSTASGSTAAIGSAGGKKLPLTSKRWQYLVREPYGEYEMPTQQLLQAEDSLDLYCDINNSYLYFDGPHHRQLINTGDKITISQSPWPLRLYRP